MVAKEASLGLQVPVIGGGGPSGYTASALFDGNILITGRVGTLGKLFAPAGPCWPSDNALVVYASSSQTDQRFLRYALQVRIAEAINMNRGAANPLITQTDLGRLEIYHPNLSDQRAIASILGSLDDKIDLNRRMNETLEAMARATFKDWFVDFGPTRAKMEARAPYLAPEVWELFPKDFSTSDFREIPLGWRVVKVRELASNIQYGLTQSAQTRQVGPWFLRITDIQGGKVDWGKVPFCEVTPSENERYRLKIGDILVARTGASTGENIYLSKVADAVFASYLVRFQFTDLAMARLVGVFMRSRAYFDYVLNALGGSAQPNASAQVLAGASLVYPTPQVARIFFDIVSAFDAKIDANNDAVQTLAHTRDLLLPKLMSGEIRLKDAEKAVEAVA